MGHSTLSFFNRRAAWHAAMNDAALDDIATKMLAAMVRTDNTVITKRLSLDEQKRYLKQYIDAVTVTDRQHIGNVLILNGLAESLKECAEGVIVNLDTLPEAVIEHMYTLLSYKLDRQ